MPLIGTYMLKIIRIVWKGPKTHQAKVTAVETHYFSKVRLLINPTAAKFSISLSLA